MTIEERKELLGKPAWNYKHLMLYTGYKKSKCFLIMKLVKKQFNGKVTFNPHVVKRDSVLEFLGTSIERERYVIKQLEDEANGTQRPLT